MRWYSRLIIVGEIRARATVRSKLGAFSVLLELLSRGFNGDGVVFPQKFGGCHHKGVSNGIDDGQGGVGCSSLDLPHVGAIDMAAACKFLLRDSEFFTTSANIYSKVLGNIHDLHIYVSR